MSAARLREAATALRSPEPPVTPPPVALALADWLDDIGLIWERHEFLADDGDPISFDESIDSHALALADTILGTAT